MLFRLQYLFWSIGNFAWAGEPIVVPLGNIGAKEVNAILPSEKGMIIIAICFQIILELLRELRKRKEKNENQDGEKLDRLYVIVHKMEGQLQEFAAAPTLTEIIMATQPHIELAVHRAMRSLEGKNKL